MFFMNVNSSWDLTKARWHAFYTDSAHWFCEQNVYVVKSLLNVQYQWWLLDLEHNDSIDS